MSVTAEYCFLNSRYSANERVKIWNPMYLPVRYDDISEDIILEFEPVT